MTGNLLAVVAKLPELLSRHRIASVAGLKRFHEFHM
jgi:hypothetical protein